MTQGAWSLSQEMLKTYGKGSMAMIVDEGGELDPEVPFIIHFIDLALGGYSEKYGTIFAEPAVAEKGYIDTRLEVSI